MVDGSIITIFEPYHVTRQGVCSSVFEFLLPQYRLYKKKIIDEANKLFR